MDPGENDILTGSLCDVPSFPVTQGQCKSNPNGNEDNRELLPVNFRLIPLDFLQLLP